MVQKQLKKGNTKRFRIRLFKAWLFKQNQSKECYPALNHAFPSHLFSILQPWQTSEMLASSSQAVTAITQDILTIVENPKKPYLCLNNVPITSLPVAILNDPLFAKISSLYINNTKITTLPDLRHLENLTILCR